ncbi:MAG: YlbF family regulator [Oscillospiraceae bacterium]|nr:YlbF family regulator [Oscillospiraceae bacterium]
MDSIKAARELGKVIQKDERYIAYHAAKEKKDADTDLGEKIKEFELIRQKLNLEASKKIDERDKDKIESLNAEAQTVYANIMENPNMIAFTAAKADMDAMISDVSMVISLCCDGEDPETCDFTPPPSAGGCGGGCGSCGGCG